MTVKGRNKVKEKDETSTLFLDVKEKIVEKDGNIHHGFNTLNISTDTHTKKYISKETEKDTIV